MAAEFIAVKFCVAADFAARKLLQFTVSGFRSS